MNLYRLDYVSPDGRTRDVRDIVGPFLTSSYVCARRRAKQEGDETGEVIRVTRISGAGSMRAIAVYSGETHRFHRVKP